MFDKETCRKYKVQFIGIVLFERKSCTVFTLIHLKQQNRASHLNNFTLNDPDPYLDVESESSLVVWPHPDGNQTMSISVTIAVRLKIATKNVHD